MGESIKEEIIREALRTRTFGRVIYSFEEIDSTNRFAKKLARLGKPEGTLIYAESQTHGRGRWSRSWDSPKGKGLWFSLILRPRLDSTLVSLLTLLGATSVSRVIERISGFNVMVKWPNDLFLNGKKLAGVLTEASRNRSRVSYAVWGIGINVNQEEEDFAPEVRERATSLRMACGESVDRLFLLAEVMNQLENDYVRTRSEGFEFILQRWISRSRILGKEILLRVNHHLVRGVVKGFHNNGDLVLLTRDGQERRYSDGHIVEVNHAVGH